MSALTTWLTAIADAIRGKDGTALPIDHADFPAKITAIPQLDTSDATAAESDILLGETAYAGGVKLTGTYEPLDTSSGDAVAADIYLNKKAWVDGAEVTGTSETAVLTDAIIITSRTGALASTVDFYGTEVFSYQFYNSTFGAWKSMTSITFKNNVTSIGTSSFYAATALVMVSLPSGLTSIGVGAFAACPNLAITSVPVGVTTLGLNTFNGCISLSSVECPRVSSVSGTAGTNGAFFNCTALANVAVGSTGYPVSGIGAYAFTGCAATGTLTVYTADGNALANSPYGWTGTVVHTQS